MSAPQPRTKRPRRRTRPENNPHAYWHSINRAPKVLDKPDRRAIEREERHEASK